MFRSLNAHRWYTILFVLLTIALAACERPLRDLEATPESELPQVTPGRQQSLPTPQTTQLPATADPLSDGTGEEAEQAVEATPESVEPVTYIVQSGDTLGAIADRYGVTIEELATANGIGNVDSLEIGQTIIIPGTGSEPVLPTAAPTEEPTEEPTAVVQPVEPTVTAEPTGEIIHIVQPGENLYRIGLLYGFTAEELAAYNGIPDPRYIDVGQEIRIPPG